MDAKQISELSNYSIISIAPVDFQRSIAKRLEVPLVPLPNNAAQGSQDKEDGLHRGESQNAITLAGTAAGIAGCHKWCELEGDHTAHRCFSTVGIK